MFLLLACRCVIGTLDHLRRDVALNAVLGRWTLVLSHMHMRTPTQSAIRSDSSAVTQHMASSPGLVVAVRGDERIYESLFALRSDSIIPPICISLLVATMNSGTFTFARTGSSSPSSKTTASDAVVVTPEESEAARLYDYHLSLLTSTASQHDLVEVSTTPLFTMPVLEKAEAIASQEPSAIFPQYTGPMFADKHPHDPGRHDPI